MMCIPVLIINAGEQTIELRPGVRVESQGFNPLFLTSPDYPNFMDHSLGHTQLSCELQVAPENGIFLDDYRLRFNVQIEDFAAITPRPMSCRHKLTLVNLLGDEMEVFSTCSNPASESFYTKLPWKA